jgi:hypothetical protein
MLLLPERVLLWTLSACCSTQALQPPAKMLRYHASSRTKFPARASLVCLVVAQKLQLGETAAAAAAANHANQLL